MEEGGGDLSSGIDLKDFDLAIDLKEGDGTGSTPEALFYVLPYLGLKELLVLETLSKQLRDAIQGDVLLWQQLYVNPPLNKKFTDVELVRLTSRAHGRLQSLSLVKCTKVTEEVIEAVVASNPLLEKLSLPGCTKVTPEAIIRMVQLQTEFRSFEVPGFTKLRIRGLYGFTTEILDKLYGMIGHNIATTSLQYYKNGEPASAIDEERTIDIEACPKCTRARMVYDCPRPECQLWRHSPLQQCRGCALCIPRCDECGTCIEGFDSEQTVCLEFVCQACWLCLPKCSECNRAGCSRHAVERSLHAGSSGSFVCDACEVWAKLPKVLGNRGSLKRSLNRRRERGCMSLQLFKSWRYIPHLGNP